MTQFSLVGDFRFFWPGSIKDFVTFPSAWDSSLNTGIGMSQLSSLWITSYFNFTALFTKLGLSWTLIEIIFWILPAIIISFLSSFFLFDYLFKDKRYAFLSGLIYLLNTYFLMILSGGQLGVSLSYSLVPLILLFVIQVLDKPSSKNLILSGMFLALQLLFDPRIVYITLVGVFVYLLFNLSKLKAIRNKLVLLTPFLTAVLLNIFWILPLILSRNSPLPSGFDSVHGFKFFSFADLSHALSLLHPNWPENIFGKVYFLDPKFLVLPILAFGSLLFTRNKNILYFVFFSLLGVFLAKGANPPFGQINFLLFEHFPGMSVFRDPTKWYILVALSYSMLIPFSLNELSRYIQSKNKFSIFNLQFTNILFFAFIFYLLFLIFPVSTQLKSKQVPQDYVRLANFLNNQKTFFRTLWIPKWQRFGYFSNNHPAIGREELFEGNAKEQIKQLEKSQELLSDLSVKYVVAPYDSEKEIFLSDREYSDKLYQETVNQIQKITWLRRIGGFGKIAVFEVPNPKDHFWSPSTSLSINYQMINPTEYRVRLKNAKEGDLLVFSEGFDKNWKAQSSGFKVRSSEFEKRLNSFVISKDGNYELRVYYEPQKYVDAGLWISGVTLLASVALLLARLPAGWFGKSLKR